MLIQNLQIGDTIKHYCCGEIVEGIVKNKGIDFVESEHPPVKWGQNTFTKTTISKSTGLQKLVSETTPSAWFNDAKLEA